MAANCAVQSEARQFTTMTDIPVLTSERLILRPHKAEDWPAYHAMRADPRVARQISNKPQTRTECWLRLCSSRGIWAFLGYGFWAVAERESGAFVGEVGFADFKREIEPSLEGMAEAGWMLSPAAFGKGYATEAMQRAFAWFDSTFPGRESACIISPENAPSLRVAEKCGFVRWTETMFMDSPVIMFRRPSGTIRGQTDNRTARA